MSILKKSTTLTAITLATCLTFGVQAEDLSKAEFSDISQQELLNAVMPELMDGNGMQTKAAGVQMKCFVDTPAWDVYRGPWCASSGTAYTTTAAFKVFNLPANTHVIWNNPNCNFVAGACLLPISLNQAVSNSAQVVNSTTGQVITTVSATARYFGGF